MSMKPYCECPTEGTAAAPESLFEPDELKTRVHAPGECRGVMDLAEYRRGGRVLTLCSTCHLSGDQRVDSAMSQPARDAMEPDRVREIEARLEEGYELHTQGAANDIRWLLDEHARLVKENARLWDGEGQRASEADVLNQELREQCAGLQVKPLDDWRTAIRVLVDATRHSTEYALAPRPATRERDDR